MRSPRNAAVCVALATGLCMSLAGTIPCVALAEGKDGISIGIAAPTNGRGATGDTILYVREENEEGPDGPVVAQPGDGRPTQPEGTPAEGANPGTGNTGQTGTTSPQGQTTTKGDGTTSSQAPVAGYVAPGEQIRQAMTTPAAEPNAMVKTGTIAGVAGALLALAGGALLAASNRHKRSVHTRGIKTGA